MPSSSQHALARAGITHDNSSAYTLNTLHGHTPTSSMSSTHTDHSALLPGSSTAYGTISNRSAPSGSPPSSTKIMLYAALKMVVIFLISTAVLGGTLWLALPTLDDDDRPLLRIPKTFHQLQDLNGLLKKYRDIYPFRIVVCYVSTYLFLQAFSLPGSMYLSILGGAVWGVPRALPLACTCVATGASLCYLLSAALGPALLTLPKWRARLEKWSDKIQSQKDNIISFLIVLRIAPIPPHWVLNIVCPHVNISLVPFWISTFFGVLGVSVIHTTIGGGLDQMTSADDFHLISWRNFLGLSAVVVGVMIPVGLRYYFKRKLDIAPDLEQSEGGILLGEEDQDQILASGPPIASAKAKAKTQQPLMLSDDESDDFFDDGDSDVILEAGPALLAKPTEPHGEPSTRDS